VLVLLQRNLKVIIAGIIVVGCVVSLIFSLSIFLEPKIIKRRYSDDPNGINIILNFEERNLLDEAISINSTVNEFLTINYNFVKSHMINQSTIGAKRKSKVFYLAYAWKIESLNLSVQVVKTLLVNTEQVNEFLFCPFIQDIEDNEDWTLNRWISTQDLEEIQVSSGWIIYQQLEHGQLYPPFPSLAGEGECARQITILDSNEKILWIANTHFLWMA
jgi:hypothetical protein